MEFRDLISRRRSTRRFTEQEVARQTIEDVVRMALQAPSGHNSRSTRLKVVMDRATIERMASIRDMGSAFLAGAPVAVIVMGDKQASDIWADNAVIVASYLQLACVEVGLASCWVHVRERQHVKGDASQGTAEEALREIVALPEECGVECIIAFGYADYTPKPLPEWDPMSAVIW